MQWSDHTHWEPGWRELAKVEGGGQASAKRAQRGSDGQVAFLKLLNRGRDPERRARFFREATAYSMFDHAGIPRLVETNAHQHRDFSASLFLATEWIEGPTLAAAGRMNLEDAYTMIRALLDIVSTCHAQDVVHRDIKPDNIILRDGAPGSPVLLDFGLTYHAAGAGDLRTEDPQEIGNRFLRLPELGANSPLKQDARSDLTFVAGLFLYALTGQHPDMLLDSAGRLPHQREPALSLLAGALGAQSGAFMGVFDQAFQQRISDRFMSAADMATSLERAMKAPTSRPGYDDDLAAFRAVVDTASGRRARDAIELFSNVMVFVREQHHLLNRDLGSAFSVTQSGWDVTPERARDTLWFTRQGEQARLVTNTFELRQAGDELVVTSGGETLFRTSADRPRLDMLEAYAVRAFLLARLKSAAGG
jgi:serine/threonine-protein kinase